MTEVEAKPTADPTPWVMSDETLRQVIADDRRRATRMAAALSAVLAAASGGLGAAAIAIDSRAEGVPIAAMLIVGGFLLMAAAIVPIVVMSVHRSRRHRWERRQRECQELAAIAQKINNPALGGLLSFNFRLMDRFVAVAIGQARMSYLACVVAASTALLVLLAGAATALTVEGQAGQVIVGALTGVGAALGSYLSVTFLHTFRMTARQMSYYYGQPLVHCYLLHAEWLGERFEQDADDDQRWQIRNELIQAVLDAGRNAQDHLLDLQLGVQRPAAPADPPHADAAGRTAFASSLQFNGNRRA